MRPALPKRRPNQGISSQPKRVPPPERWSKTKQKAYDLSQKINTFNDAIGITNPGGLLSLLLAAYPMLRQDDIGPDLDHKGWPALPEFPGDQDYTQARNEVMRVQALLEKNLVIRLQTEADFRKSMAGVNAMAGFHPLVGLGVQVQVAQGAPTIDQFYVVHDDAVNKGLNKINQLLVHMAHNRADPYFYPEHCMPFYLFVYKRYSLYTRAF